MKLAEIDPITLAREVVSAAYDAIIRRTMAIDLHLELRILREGEQWDPRAEWARPKDGVGVWGAPESTTLGHAVVALTCYAQSGERLDADVQEYCVMFVGAADEDLDDASSPDPSTPLGLVVAAALAREQIEQGEPVRTAHLAALAGVTSGRVRQLVASGELRVTTRGGDDYVRAADARRWLGGRGVPGMRK